MTCAFLAARPAHATLSQHCLWGGGTGAVTPSIQTNSTQVMMMPVVADFHFALGNSQIAFISFANPNQINQDRGGVLRIIDGNCQELATYPDSSPPPPPPCPTNLNTVPDLAPTSGLAVGILDNSSTLIDIVAVIGGPSANHKQIVDFNLVAGKLQVKWCSPPLTGGDFIAKTSAPAIAQMDKGPSYPAQYNEIVIDNKVFDYSGNLRYSGFSVSGPRSRTVAAAAPFGGIPEVITGRGKYYSSVNFWTGTQGWVNTAVTNSGLVYPAIGEFDSNWLGPEVVVVDTMANTVSLLSSANGSQLASAILPNVPGCPGSTPLSGTCPCPGPNCPKCGGPPMISDVDGVAGPEIGVVSCNRYTLFKYNGTSVLKPIISWPISDASGQTTSTLFTKTGFRRIYYADEHNLWVFDPASNTPIQSLPNPSGTAIEGPVVAALADGGPGKVIVAANKYASGGTLTGVRIFDEPQMGPVRRCWNEHAYHVTNLSDCFGNIPSVEPMSWLLTSPARNTYRVQWP